MGSECVRASLKGGRLATATATSSEFASQAGARARVSHCDCQYGRLTDWNNEHAANIESVLVDPGEGPV
jgi:hypothetical protein